LGRKDKELDVVPLRVREEESPHNDDKPSQHEQRGEEEGSA